MLYIMHAREGSKRPADSHRPTKTQAAAKGELNTMHLKQYYCVWRARENVETRSFFSTRYSYEDVEAAIPQYSISYSTAYYFIIHMRGR